MAAINLYPPILDTYQPAFVAGAREDIEIFYTVPSFVNIENIKQIQLKISSQDNSREIILGSEGIYCENISLNKNVPSREFKLKIKRSFLDIGNIYLNTFYRIQIRFSQIQLNNSHFPSLSWLNENKDKFSDWSTISLIKAISPYNIIFDQNFSADEKNITYVSNFGQLSGRIVWANSEEVEYLEKYQFTIYENNNKLDLEDILAEKISCYEQSPIIYNNLKDNNRNSFTYLLTKEYEENSTYLIVFDYETSNGYKSNLTKNICIINKDLETKIEDVKCNIEINKNKFCTDFYFTFEEKWDSGSMFALYRSSNKSNYQEWKDIFYFYRETEDFIEWSDMTIENGIFYKYAIKEVFLNGLYSKNKILNENYICAETEDIFILNKDNLLKISYDAQINGLQRNKKKEMIETIGNQYPFVRSGAVLDYKTFSISGTIAYSDDIFVTKEWECHHDTGIKEELSNIKTDNIFLKEDLSIYNEDDFYYIKEKIYRDKVWNFLEDNTTKLIKTGPEGNILVQLSNISLSPKIELGRLLYSFEATATEIDSCDIDLYKKYDILNTSESYTKAYNQLNFYKEKDVFGQIFGKTKLVDYRHNLVQLIKDKYNKTLNKVLFNVKNISYLKIRIWKEDETDFPNNTVIAFIEDEENLNLEMYSTYTEVELKNIEINNDIILIASQDLNYEIVYKITLEMVPEKQQQELKEEIITNNKIFGQEIFYDLSGDQESIVERIKNKYLLKNDQGLAIQEVNHFDKIILTYKHHFNDDGQEHIYNYPETVSFLIKNNLDNNYYSHCVDNTGYLELTTDNNVFIEDIQFNGIPVLPGSSRRKDELHYNRKELWDGEIGHWSAPYIIYYAPVPETLSFLGREMYEFKETLLLKVDSSSYDDVDELTINLGEDTFADNNIYWIKILGYDKPIYLKPIYDDESTYYNPTKFKTTTGFDVICTYLVDINRRVVIE